MNTIWTIGHSTLPLTAFIAALGKNRISALADVRRFPASQRYPHFNKIPLHEALHKVGVSYTHYPGLGGRREPRPYSRNTAWKNRAFRGYADHMETEEFLKAFAVLAEQGKKENTVYMCAEAVWWSCHRALISDLFLSKGWRVLHILGDQVTEHPYSSAARIINGTLSYKGDDTLF